MTEARIRLKQFIYGVFAGVCIGIGGIVFLSVENVIIGSFLFGVGLFTVVVFRLQLFTGRIGYLPDNKPIYLIELLITWVGNFAGTYLAGTAIRYTRIFDNFNRLGNIVYVKLNDDILSIFILSLFCGMLMFIAVETFKTAKDGAVKVIGVFIPVMVFILCGFEHCVANMFYFSAAGAWNSNSLFRIVIMTLGNSFGGLIMPFAVKLLKSEK